MAHMLHHPFKAWIPWLYVLMFIPVIAAGARQAELGWRSAVAIQPAPLADAPHRVALRVVMTDAEGKPLTGLTLSGRIVSPVDPQPDAAVTLVETGGGHYREVITLPRAGQWELQLLATGSAGQFAIVQRLAAP